MHSHMHLHTPILPIPRIHTYLLILSTYTTKLDPNHSTICTQLRGLRTFSLGHYPPSTTSHLDISPLTITAHTPIDIFLHTKILLMGENVLKPSSDEYKIAFRIQEIIENELNGFPCIRTYEIQDYFQTFFKTTCGNLKS